MRARFVEHACMRDVGGGVALPAASGNGEQATTCNCPLTGFAIRTGLPLLNQPIDVPSDKRARRARYTGSKARIGGRLPLNRSTSMVVSCPVQPCAKDEVPMSRVSTFGLP